MNLFYLSVYNELYKPRNLTMPWDLGVKPFSYESVWIALLFVWKLFANFITNSMNILFITRQF